MGARAPVSIRLSAGDGTDHLQITGTLRVATVRIESGEPRSLQADLSGRQLVMTLNGLRALYTVAAADGKIWLAGGGATVVFEEVREASVRPDDEHSGDAE